MRLGRFPEDETRFGYGLGIELCRLRKALAGTVNVDMPDATLCVQLGHTREIEFRALELREQSRTVDNFGRWLLRE